MKNFIFIITILMFTVNGFAVAAMAGNCMQSPLKTITQDKIAQKPCHQMSMDENTPYSSHSSAHDSKQDKQNNNSKYCEGICLCLHASISSGYTLPDKTPMYFGVSSFSHVWLTDTALNSATLSPPLQPPKLFS